MSDIFIGYVSEDWTKARVLADSLLTRSCKVE